MPEEPLAYFITFRCYGTWLHGDARGSTSWSSRGHALRPEADPVVERASRDRLKFPPFTLADRERGAVREAIEETVAFRGWQLLAVNVRTNHVHVVVAAPDRKPEHVMTALKAYSTRRLVAERLVTRGRAVWSRHGSTIYLWNEQEIEDTCAYVIEGQD